MQGWTVPLIVACALFMESMDSTVISTSLPVIAADLGENPIALKLALTSYLVSLAVFIPISGWVADRFGARRVFRLAVLVFMAGSLWCGFSDTLGGFVVARFVQGMGGAMMVPVGRLVLLRSVEKSDFVRVMSFLTIPALIGPVIGPPLGGFISTYFDWRWIFFLNIPIGVLGIFFAARIPDVREEEPGPLDAQGFVWSALGLSLLTLGLATAGQHLLSTQTSVACVLGGVAALLLYVRHARRMVQRGARPLLDFRLMRILTFRVGVLGGTLYRLGVGAMPFLLPLMLQLGFGYNAMQSGLLTCMSALASMFSKPMATVILRRFGFRQVLVWNALIVGAFIAAYGLFTPATPFVVMAIVLFLGGGFRSLHFTCLNAITFADIEKKDMSSSNSFANVVQQLALSGGITIGAVILETGAMLHGRAVVAPLDFAVAFPIVGLITFASFWYGMKLNERSGAEMAGRPVAREPARDD